MSLRSPWKVKETSMGSQKVLINMAPPSDGKGDSAGAAPPQAGLCQGMHILLSRQLNTYLYSTSAPYTDMVVRVSGP